MSGGGGGDGGAAERAAATETKKQQARDQLNYLFGAGDPASMVNRDNYYSEVTTRGARPDTDSSSAAIKGALRTTKTFDQAAYDAAVAEAAKKPNPNKEAREKLYQGVRDNAFNAGKTALDEANANAQRQNKFSLFAQGLNGGSADIDQNALLGQTYNKGLLDLGAKADGAKSELKSSDESTRLNLLNAINAGTDQSSAISSAINQMKNNYDSAASNAQTTNLGDLFAQSGALYTQSQKAKGQQAASDWWNDFSGGGGGSKSNSSARTGVSTRTY